MRSLLRYIADALLSVALSMFFLLLHFSLASVCRANLQRILAAQSYRPIYSRAGRRNRVRC